MSEACKKAFLEQWDKEHDFPFNENGGLYEKHAYKFFCAGWQARKLADYTTQYQASTSNVTT